MKVDDWVFTVGMTLGGLALIGLFLALGKDWLRGRRKPQRRRCPKCWYNMEATPGLRCPECGKEAANEKRLGKFRRRWRLATLCVFIITASSVAVGLTRSDPYGWIRWTPTFVLIRLADSEQRIFDFASNSQSPRALANFELWQRYFDSKLSLKQRRDIARRTIANRPPIVFESRSRWPAGADLYVVLRQDFERPVSVQVTAMIPYERRVRFPSHPSDTRSSHLRNVLLGALTDIGPWPTGTRSIPFSVAISERGEEIWSGTVPFAVRVDAQLNELVEPVSSGLAAGLVRGALTKGVSVSAEGRWLRVDLGVESDWTMIGDLTLGLKIEFMYGDERVAWATIAHTPVIGASSTRAAVGYGPSSSSEIYVPIFGDTARLAQCHEQAGWELRFTGDGGTALRDFGAITFWEGEVVVPLASVMEHETADLP